MTIAPEVIRIPVSCNTDPGHAHVMGFPFERHTRPCLEDEDALLASKVDLGLELQVKLSLTWRLFHFAMPCNAGEEASQERQGRPLR